MDRYFIIFSKTCTNHGHCTINKPFHRNHNIENRCYLFSYLCLFFKQQYFFRSLPTVPRQYLPLSKSFSTNVGELQKLLKQSTQCLFSNSLDNSKNNCFLNPEKFLTFSKICTKHCHCTIIKPLHSNHIIDILKIVVTSFHIPRSVSSFLQR